ncbi:MAG TPA: glycoside hydrolase family 5 protein [Capsulimonadaceae bacterium]|jgi:endoglucanase
MNYTSRFTLALVAAAALTLALPCKSAPLPFTGVNISGGEFGGSPKPGERLAYNVKYTYPKPAEIDYFASKGMNIIRFPFHWEALQPEPLKSLDAVDLARFKAVVDYATSKGLTVLLDPHNSARYYGQIVGGPDVSTDVFADFWSRMSLEFKDNSRVWFGLTNEPNSMPNDVWLADANAAIAAIRKTGAKNRILVAGNGYSAACDWMGNGNDVVMLGVKDPKNNWIFEPHAYLDEDNSGTHKTVVSATIGVERLTAFTEWCRKHKFRALLGEFAVPEHPLGRDAIDNMVGYMEKNRDVWVGFTWWSAGPWWGNYMFSIEPKDGIDKPQLAYLAGHLQPTLGDKSRENGSNPR